MLNHKTIKVKRFRVTVMVKNCWKHLRDVIISNGVIEQFHRNFYNWISSTTSCSVEVLCILTLFEIVKEDIR